MKTYYVFNIKSKIYTIYKKNPKSLYKTLYNLKNINKIDMNLGLSIYNEICDIFKFKEIKKYIKLLPIAKNIQNKYLINKNIIIIKPARIIIKCMEINEDIVYILNNYNNHLFICNFKSNEYYWINEL